MTESLSIFDFMNQFLQTQEELTQATQYLLEDLRDDGVVRNTV